MAGQKTERIRRIFVTLFFLQEEAQFVRNSKKKTMIIFVFTNCEMLFVIGSISVRLNLFRIKYYIKFPR